MKKLLLIVTIIFTSYGLQAQRIGFGLRAGADVQLYKESGYFLSYSVGGHVSYLSSKWFDATLLFDYAPFFSTTYSSDIDISKIKGRADYIRFALPLSYYASMSDDFEYENYVHIGIGPYLSFLPHATATLLYVDDHREKQIVNIGNSPTDDIKRLDVGFQLQFKINLGRYFMGFEYFHGFTNVIPSENKPLKLRRMAFVCGISFYAE